MYGEHSIIACEVNCTSKVPL